MLSAVCDRMVGGGGGGGGGGVKGQPMEGGSWVGMPDTLWSVNLLSWQKSICIIL